MGEFFEHGVLTRKGDARMKLSVCVDALYMGKNIKEAIDDVLEQGIKTIEFWGWEDKNIEELVEYQKEKNFEVATFCTKFISLVDSSCHEAYIEGLIETIEVAKQLNCKCLITQTGAAMEGDRKVQYEALVAGLKKCVPYLEENDMTLVVEPLNIRVDHAGYFLSSSDEAACIMKEVASEHVKMLFDVYHQQITEGDLCRRIDEYQSLIGHYHAAGNPGRHELFNSEIDYQKVFDTIKQTGYTGYVGLEYFPEKEPAEGLQFCKKVI